MPLLARFTFSDGRPVISCEGDSYKELLRHLYYQLQPTSTSRRTADVNVDGESFTVSNVGLRSVLRQVWSQLHVVNPEVLWGLGCSRELQRYSRNESPRRQREYGCRQRREEEEERDRSRSRPPHPRLREEDSEDDLEWLLEPSGASDFYRGSSSESSDVEDSDESVGERDREEEPVDADASGSACAFDVLDLPEFANATYCAFDLYSRRDGHKWLARAVILYIVCFFSASLITMAAVRARLAKKIRDLSSVAERCRQQSIIRSLTTQALLPACMIIGVVCFFLDFFGIYKSPYLQRTAHMTVSIFAFISPLVTLTLLRPYRRFVQQLCRCSPRPALDAQSDEQGKKRSTKESVVII